MNRELRTALAQETPESLAALWLEAIKAHSPAMVMPLVHPSCSQENIHKDIIERMISGDLPTEVTVTTEVLSEKVALAKVFEVAPEMQLNLNYVTQTKEDRKKYGIGKGFPIALYNAKWFFVICTNQNSATP
jgi:hypothetical protein